MSMRDSIVMSTGPEEEDDRESFKGGHNPEGTNMFVGGETLGQEERLEKHSRREMQTAYEMTR